MKLIDEANKIIENMKKCDWMNSNCANVADYKVTLNDGYERHVCKEHLQSRIECCGINPCIVEGR